MALLLDALPALVQHNLTQSSQRRKERKISNNLATFAPWRDKF
jgi:hypothetical protein